MITPMEPLDLDDAFEDLMRKANPTVKQHSVQYRESRRMFFSGAASIFMHLLQVATLPEREAETQLGQIEKQIEEFFKDRLAHEKD